MLPQTQRFCVEHVMIKKLTGSPHRFERYVCPIVKQDGTLCETNGKQCYQSSWAGSTWISPLGIHLVFWAKAELALCCATAARTTWFEAVSAFHELQLQLICSMVMLRVTCVVQGCPYCDVLAMVVCCSHKLTGVLQLWASSKQHTTRSELTCSKHSIFPMSSSSTEKGLLRTKFQHRKIF